VDLDLSSLNTVIKPNIPGTSKSNKISKKGKENVNPRSPEADEIAYGAQPQNEDGSASPEPAQQTLGQEIVPEQDAADLIVPSHVQVLDLHTTNPIISYQDHVYSCAWVDLIGTNMFFAQPGMSEDVHPLVSTDDYELLGTSTIKLLGHRANIQKSLKKRARPDDDGDDRFEIADTQQNPEGRSLGTLIRTNAKKNVQIKKQATFLEKLMEIKDKRGHQDTVRTYVDETIASSEQSKLSKSQCIEIDHLNRRVVRGDAEALESLQKIYSQLDGDGNDDNAMEPSDGLGGPPGPENMQSN
jgi:hypothetical protein